jgi:hypothetical protein
MELNKLLREDLSLDLLCVLCVHFVEVGARILLFLLLAQFLVLVHVVQVDPGSLTDFPFFDRLRVR